jgi:hypothetical protein
MVGTTAGNPLDRLTDVPPSPLAAAPPAAEVEVELQRIARRRLAPPPDTDVASRTQRDTRSFRQRRPSVVGGFDSPEGFAFGSESK